MSGSDKSTDRNSDDVSELQHRIAELEATQEEKDRLLSAFTSISMTVLASLDLNTILDSLSQQIIAAGLFRSLMISIVDHENQLVRVDRGFQLDRNHNITRLDESHEEIGISYRIGDRDILAETVRKAQIQIAEEWDDRFTLRPGTPVEKFKGQVAYFVPIKQGNQVLAVLATGSRIDQKDHFLCRIEMM